MATPTPPTPPLPHQQPEEPPAVAKSAPVRFLLLLLAVLSLCLGVVGLFLPLLPTVPFLLLAAWAAARSSPRLQRALLNHRRLGPPIRDWQSSGVIRRPAKAMATLAMAFSAAMVWAMLGNPWVQGAATACMGGVLLWIWSRPEQAPPQAPARPA